MSLSTYYLEDGRYLARLHRRRRRRRRAYAPTSNTASHDNQEKIGSWVSFSFLYGYKQRYVKWYSGAHALEYWPAYQP